MANIYVLFLLASFVIIGEVQYFVASELTGEEQVDLMEIFQNCSDFLLIKGSQTEPSPKCCNAIKHVNITEIPQQVDPADDDQEYSVKKFLHACRVCNNLR